MARDIAHRLNALIEVDLDAIEAYEVAIDRIDDEGDKAQLADFRADHERHVRELQAIVRDLGETPATKPDIKRVLTKGKVVIAALVGDRPILLAMKTNEDDTNLAYDAAIASEEGLPEHVREVLLRNRDDERRHLAYVEERLLDYEGEREVLPGARTDVGPTSHSPMTR
jgi:uncharacterized protein (TIGR02284 family)